MFTGIVEAQGRVKLVQKKGRSLRLTVEVPRAYAGLKSGSSVAVDGVCLTVIRAGATRRLPAGQAGAARTLSFDVVPETMKRTRFRDLKVGETVNLERPLRWKGRVEGHLVQGHVDGTAKVLRSLPQGRGRSFRVACPKKLGRYLLEKGSVALNGVSLTVGRRADAAFWVHVIPHTLKKTNLGSWEAGSRANLEVDLWMKAFDKARRAL